MMPLQQTLHAANRLGLDYAAEAAKFTNHPFPIVDIHTHLSGGEAARVYQDVARRYGIERTYSMTPEDGIEAVRAVLGDAVRFIAIPKYWRLKSTQQLGEQYARQIERMHAAGSRIAKFWSAPRRRDMEDKAGLPNAMRLDAPHILDAMAAAAERNMVIMVHIGDPDTWFSTNYVDAARYGVKREQYEPLEAALERFPVPFIAAHMVGWPEDLGFLSDLLARHDRLHLDTSATKWMVRELSKHSQAAVVRFFTRWKGRILFGSDIVTSNKHLRPNHLTPAASAGEAFDLYASRYWALRTLFETNHNGPSPIADPDLQRIDAQRFDAMSAPQLVGKQLPPQILQSLLHDAAANLLQPLESTL